MFDKIEFWLAKQFGRRRKETLHAGSDSDLVMEAVYWRGKFYILECRFDTETKDAKG